MTPYRFAFLRIFFGVYLIAFFATTYKKTALPEAEFIYLGLLSFSILFLIGYQRRLIACSLAFFSYLIFAVEKSLLQLDTILMICVLLYFALVTGTEPWKIRATEQSTDKVSKDLKLDLDFKKLTFYMILEVVLFGAAFIAAYVFHLIAIPHFHSWTTWGILGFFAILIFPKFIFRPKNLSPPPILFFDGVCGLCSHVVDFVFAEDTQSVFKVAALQGETAKAKLPKELHENLNSVVVLSHNGELFQKSEAILNILHDLGGFWRIFFVFRLLPRPLTDMAYNLIAKNRYKIFGKTETCRLPTPAERSKFLN